MLDSIAPLRQFLLEARKKALRAPIRVAITLVELLVVIAISAVLIALLVPAVQKVRAAAASSQCVNNMRQIGLAAQTYHNTFKCFPTMQRHSGWSPQTWRNSWLYQILPYLEQEALYKQGQSTDVAEVDKTVSTIVATFICPADPRENAGGLCVNFLSLEAYHFALTSYLGVVGENSTRYWDGVFGAEVGIRMDQITDGTAYTVMAGERPPSRDTTWGWWSSTTVDNALWAIGQLPNRDLPNNSAVNGRGDPCPTQSFFSPGELKNYCHVNHFWSFHSDGGNWLLCDGAVRFMAYSAGTTVIPPMATIAGGEVPVLDW